LKKKVKASKGLVEPIQVKMLGRRSTSGCETLDIFVTEVAVDAISQHDQIVVASANVDSSVILDFEQQMDAEFAGAVLQDQHQQRAARTAAEAVAAVGRLEGVERLVGEDHAEAKRVIGLVALVQRDIPMRPGLLGQDGEEQARRPAADH
jgi:S-adenosylmethionine synthetase